MIHFKLKTVANNEPMSNDPFWKYLDDNVEKGGRFYGRQHVQSYIEILGFDRNKHTLQEGQLTLLIDIAKFWYDVTPWAKPMSLAQLFTFDSKALLYYVKGLPAHRGITPELKALVERTGWVYGVCPNTTYFEIIRGNKLYAKYQSILGSRFLCEISDLIQEAA